MSCAPSVRQGRAHICEPVLVMLLYKATGQCQEQLATMQQQPGPYCLRYVCNLRHLPRPVVFGIAIYNVFSSGKTSWNSSREETDIGISK